jgi:hypothetical protein
VPAVGGGTCVRAIWTVLTVSRFPTLLQYLILGLWQRLKKGSTLAYDPQTQTLEFVLASQAGYKWLRELRRDDGGDRTAAMQG